MEKRAVIALNENKDRVIKIIFSNDDLDSLHKVRSLPGRKFHSKHNCWSTPVRDDVIHSLKNWGFLLDQILEKKIAKTDYSEKIKNLSIPGLKKELRLFQKAGVHFIERHNGRILLADEMGLGKTIQTLAWLQLRKEVRPAIIVTPASLKLNWAKEAIDWMKNPQVEILTGQTPWTPSGKILIINYDILSYWVRALMKINAMVLITDECYYYQNTTAQRTKQLKLLAKGIPKFIAISGNPIENRPIEIYNAWKLTDPEGCPEYWDFTGRYCKRHRNGFGWDMSGASHTEELHQRLVDTIMLRRKKDEVLTDLPAKTRSFIPIQLYNEAVYQRAEEDFLTYIRETKGREAEERASRAESFAKVEVLKQLAVEGKMTEAIEWIDNFLKSGRKLVVFAVHKSVIKTLMTKFGDIAVKVDGSCNAPKKEEAKVQFQTNPNIRLFVGNINAARMGLTLTAAHDLVFLELPWTPGALGQAEDRVHRITQTKGVVIYFLLALGTIEEKIAKLLDKKRKVLDAILDGVETTQDDLLSELISEYKQLKPRKK